MPQYVQVSSDGPVGIVTLDRPKQLNALSGALMRELVEAVEGFEAQTAIRAVVITGGERVFAAGADLREMAEASVAEMVAANSVALWDRLRNASKPLIAAVSGYALGGGCELALVCDVIVASETARFGQPELNVGLMPGAGGTQRLTRAVGKYVALDMLLTGRQLSAEEALRFGLAARVVPPERVTAAAVAMGKQLAEKPPLSVRFAKQAVAHAAEGRVDDGIALERALFFLLFGTRDAHEGMRAFVERRRPSYEGA